LVFFALPLIFFASGLDWVGGVWDGERAYTYCYILCLRLVEMGGRMEKKGEIENQ
jgi:hypothetical protein